MIRNIADDIQKCCGCGSCKEICPTQSIEMVYNKDGFLFPKVLDSCIECHLCQKKCPANNKIDGYKMQEAFSVSSKDKDPVKQGCSSGGAAYEFSKKIILDNGIVFGACFSENYRKAEHHKICNAEQLLKLRGSKYMQSETGCCYSEAKELLNRGVKVLYIGTPCQIAGLRSFLNKDYDNLVTVDFMCHGVMSTRIYQEFLDSLNFSTITYVNFRSKEQGYNFDCPVEIKDDSGHIYKKSWYKECSLGKAFANSIISRTSCSECNYANNFRMSDITLADFISPKNSEDDKIYGASLVTINTNKGKILFDSIKNEIEFKGLDLRNVENTGHFSRPSLEHRYRKKVFKHIDDFQYTKLARKYFVGNYKEPITINNFYRILIREVKQAISKLIHRILRVPQNVSIKDIKINYKEN